MASKPRKKKITTIEEDIEQDQTPAPVIPTIPYDPEMDTLETVLSQWGTTPGVKIKISRLENGAMVYVHTYPDDVHSVTEVDEALIQRIHKGGKYVIKVYDGANVIQVLNRTISDPATDNAKKDNPAAPTDLAAVLQQQNTILLQALMQRNGNGHDATPAGELAQAVATLHGIARPPQEDQSGKIFEAFFKGVDFMARGGQPPEDNSWGGFFKSIVRDAAPHLAPMLGGLLNRPQLPAGANGAPMPIQNPSANPGLPPAIQAIIAQGFDYLKKKALAGKNPEAFVISIMENRDEDLNQWLVGIIQDNEFELIAQTYDPEIALPRYRPFFEGIYNGVRQALIEEQTPEIEEDDNGPETPNYVNPIGTGGNPGNPPNNGGPGKGRVKKPKG
jgi:hypothetical protein